MMTKAVALFDQEAYTDAEAIYRRVHALNPYDTEAIRGIAECEQSVGHVAEALKYIQQFVSLDPTNPRFILIEAQYFEWAGQTDRAKQLLIHWIHKNRASQPLPIILYHGLTPFADDPLLAHLLTHYTTQTFEEHIRALRDAGYTPVTTRDVLDWSGGKKAPAHPVLIAFDDGRLDSFTLPG